MKRRRTQTTAGGPRTGDTGKGNNKETTADGGAATAKLTLPPSGAAIQLGGTELRKHRHVCAFFASPEEEYHVLMPFIREGFARGDAAVHLVDARLRQGHLARLREAGIDIAAAQAERHLDVRSWGRAYLRGRRFDQDAMLGLLDEVLGAASARGCSLTRLIAHMEWALEDMPGVGDLIEYEARVNYVACNRDDPVICVYDATRFSATTAFDVLRTHPIAIIGGIVHENGYYVEPGELLEELRSRTPRRDASRPGTSREPKPRSTTGS